MAIPHKIRTHADTSSDPDYAVEEAELALLELLAAAQRHDMSPSHSFSNGRTTEIAVFPPDDLIGASNEVEGPAKFSAIAQDQAQQASRKRAKPGGARVCNVTMPARRGRGRGRGRGRASRQPLAIGTATGRASAVKPKTRARKSKPSARTLCEDCGVVSKNYGTVEERKVRWCGTCAKAHNGVVLPIRRPKSQPALSPFSSLPLTSEAHFGTQPDLTRSNSAADPLQSAR
eukprot:SAG31_NODE_3401_length_4314_cov_2.157770_1_plen_231_part_00